MNYSFFQIFIALIPLFGLAFLGAFFRYRGTMDAKADSTILWLIIHLFTPCLIFDSILGKKALEDLFVLVKAPLVGFSTVIIGLGIAWCGAKLLKLSSFQARTFIPCVALYNFGYIPIPVISLFFDGDVLGVLFLFNMGFELAMWSIAFWILAGSHGSKSLVRRFFRPPLVALLLAITMNSIFGYNPLPESIMRMIHMMGQATIPLALLFVGTAAFDHGAIVGSRPWSPMIVAVFLRLLVIPAVFMIFVFFCSLPDALRIVVAVQAGMPAAVLPVVLTQKYQGDIQLAIRIFIVTSILSLLTMPWWLSIAFAIST